MRAALAPLPLPILPPYRYYIPTGVLDQNGFPRCVGYAWHGWLRCTPLRTLLGPSADTIYQEAQKVDEWEGEGYDGTSVRAGAKYLQAQGRVGEYLWAEEDQTVRRWLATKGPVVLGTDWYTGMFSPGSDGVVRLTGQVEGGHAYLCIGYSDTRQAFRCINSWGSGWGQKGRFWLTYAALALLLQGGNGEACGAVEIRP